MREQTDDMDVEIDLQEAVPDHNYSSKINTRQSRKRRSQTSDLWTDSVGPRRSGTSHNRQRYVRPTVTTHEERSAPIYNSDFDRRHSISKGRLDFLVIIFGIIGGIFGGFYGSLTFESVQPHYNDDLWHNFSEFILAEGWNSFGWLGTVLLWGTIAFVTISAASYFTIKSICVVT